MSDSSGNETHSAHSAPNVTANDSQSTTTPLTAAATSDASATSPQHDTTAPLAAAPTAASPTDSSAVTSPTASEPTTPAAVHEEKSLFAPLPPPPTAVPNVAVPADIDAIFTRIYRERPSVREPVIKLLKQIVGFVVNKPEEQKYRSLKIAAVVDKLKAVEAAIDLLDVVGFKKSSETHWTLLADASMDRLAAAYHGLLYREYEHALKKWNERVEAEAKVNQLKAASDSIRQSMADQKAADKEEAARRLAHFKGEETKAAPKPNFNSGATSRSGRALDVLEQMERAGGDKKDNSGPPKKRTTPAKLSASGRPLDLLEQMDRDSGPSKTSTGPKRKIGMGDMMSRLEADNDAPAKRSGPPRKLMGDVLKNMELDDTRDGPRAATGPPRKGLRGSAMMKDLDADRMDKPSTTPKGPPMTGEERLAAAKKKGGMDPARAARWEAQRKFAELRASGGSDS